VKRAHLFDREMLSGEGGPRKVVQGDSGGGGCGRQKEMTVGKNKRRVEKVRKESEQELERVEPTPLRKVSLY
jgi:hypothetical protein